MIQITDRLLSLPDMSRCAGADLRRLYRLLLETGVAKVEVSAAVREKLGGAVVPERTALRLSEGEIADGGARIAELRFDSAAEFPSGARFPAGEPCRITGLDDLLLYDYPQVFGRLRCYAGAVEFCPGDRRGFATALALEWLERGGERLAVSFLGAGGFAPLEEVLVGRHVTAGARRGAPEGSASFAVLRELKRAYEEATGEAVPPHKPVVGDRIFWVESGIHVDGILKNPANYEPFLPELLGMTHTVTLGTHSGRGSIRHALRERGLEADEGAVGALLRQVQDASARLGRGLTDAEFDMLRAGSP
ncbi:homocitrate synthase/isopropylmalate synthase family protein [Treponema endosymbiont of Eucomonympha sp.]|uniref:homocitrate synthase/isopropylmalate synthase family protein n=1 Tax=Treponema endosymbiont of Eucomonympha sp. TaxID=1580831 RepID=UPI00078266D9|nr:hypothetical protein [Treponema endosymbiont of Eucomonympha sp.]